MLSPVPVAIRVESNIFAPAPTRIGAALIPVATNLHLRAVPVNVPLYWLVVIVQSISVPFVEPPKPEPNPEEETEHLVKTPDAAVNPDEAEQSVKVPDAVPPNDVDVAVHRVNVPLAVPFPPNDSAPATQSSNIPDANVVALGLPPRVPPNE